MFRRGPRPKTCLCTCKSHCTTFNPAIGQYEGPGVIQSRSTRDNHAKDDRLLAAQQRATSPGERSRFSFFRRRPTRPEGQSNPPQVPQPSPEHSWINLIEHEVTWLSELPVTFPNFPLVFLHDPATNGEYSPPSESDLIRPNHGLYALVPDRRANRANQVFLSTENRLCELASQAETLEPSEETEALSRRIYEQLRCLSRQKEYNWAQQRTHMTPGRIVENTEMHYYQRGPRNIVSKAAALVSLIMSHLFFTPRRALGAQLAGQKDVLRACGASPETLTAIPKDPRSTGSQFLLDAVTRQFLSCPRCFCLHPYHPGDSPQNGGNPAISRCTFRLTPQSPLCDAPLWKERDIGGGRTRFAPRRLYLHHVLKSWVGRFLSRPGMETLLKECCDASPTDQNAPIGDIWSSQVLRALLGVDGNPFFPGPPGEVRLVFSLSVDSFNPFHMKIAKQQVSSTGIWLVLLNLPPHLRYLPENVFLVGVLPDKPATHQLNHALGEVVKDLGEFWEPGVFFTRTYNHRAGKLARAMLVPLVCDMLAARQVLGLPGTTTAHYFCTFCDLDIDDIDVLDRSEWPAKDPEHIRRIAKLWRDAPSEAQQEDIFRACGLRWSALLDLPYWNPVLYTVIESMHALDLGLFQNHLRRLFRIDVVNAGGDGSSEPPAPVNKRTKDHTGLQKCIELICEEPPSPALLYRLLGFDRTILYTICVETDIKGVGHDLVVGTRWVLANNIFHWRHSAAFDRAALLRLPSALRRPTPAPDVETNVRSSSVLPENENISIPLATRIISHLTNIDDPVEGRRKAYGQGSAAIFMYLCDVLAIDHSHISVGERSAKSSAFELLTDTIEDDVKFRELAAYIPAKSRHRVVLGRDIMEAIWADMERTQLPAWIRPAPSNWGTSERGKLSADQYRVICTIHVVITLIRLWGKDTGRKKDMLKHFMDLVSAVRIANLRVTSRQKIEAYNTFIFRYAARCIELFPDEKLKPTLHAALHIGDIMQLFGPVHAYSAPFYERYINFFHRMNTNQKLGELESTFTHVATRASNLRALLSDDADVRATVSEMIQKIEATEREDARGYRLASLVDPTAPDYSIDSNALPIELSEEVYQDLHTIIMAANSNRELRIFREALSVKQISIRDVAYGTSTSSTFKNSRILFQRSMDDPNEEPSAATILEIFQHTHQVDGESRSEFYLLVQDMLPVDPTSDPYREFGFAAGFLCSKVPAARSRVIKLSQVISHVAITTIEAGDYAGLIHVLPVDRLMMSFRIGAISDVLEEEVEEL